MALFLHFSPFSWAQALLDQEESCQLVRACQGLIPGSGRSPGEGNGNPFQYPCLGNPMDKGAWWATVHGVTEESATA